MQIGLRPGTSLHRAPFSIQTCNAFRQSLVTPRSPLSHLPGQEQPFSLTSAGGELPLSLKASSE